jgi:PAS domain S-box-containing protein
VVPLLRALVAEDNAADAELIGYELRRAGLRVEITQVGTLHEFEHQLRSSGFDVVLTDYNLPGWSGLEAIRIGRELAPGIPIIVVSGSLGDEGAVECLRQGATDYALKHRLERLHLAVSRAVRERALQREAAQRESELRQSEERFRGTFEQAAVGMAHLTLEGQWIQVNQRLADLLGYSKAELLAIPALALAHPSYADQPDALGRPVTDLDTPSARRMSRLLKKDDSPVWVEITTAVVRLSDGAPSYLMAVIEDITDRKQLETEFLQAQKMEAVGRLASGVAHDFNNLLTAIDGYGELLLDDLAPDDPHRADVQEILLAGKRAGSLTRQLLAFSRRQVMEVRVLDLGEIVKGMEKMTRRLVGQHIDITVRLNGQLRPVRVDPGQVEQVMLNLIVNAADAMPDRGSLVIETMSELLREPTKLTTGELPAGEYITLSVSDTGGGIDPETAPRIFEPFFTTKAPGKGTGLGLSTVYGIVKQFGGNIAVISRPTGGTEFRVYLPAVQSQEEKADDVTRETAATAGSETVLIVEDESPVRVFMRRTLEKQGYTVFEAANGREAIQRITHAPGDIDLVISDVVMPQMGGVELIAQAQAAGGAIRAIYMSGYADQDLGALDLTRPGIGFLQKPFDSELLARRVREVLDGPPMTAT